LILLAAILNADSIWRFFYPLPYRDLTFKYARAYNQDPYLLAAMMKAESNFDNRAVSARGARGLMQIMPETGQSVASALGYSNFSPDQLFEPEININIGAWYLADLDNEFYGNVILMLAAYNGGRGNVREWVSDTEKSGGIKTFDQIPFPETRYYVKKVLLYHKIYTRLYSQGGG
jgi:soluble lytic murein transglycosylase